MQDLFNFVTDQDYLQIVLDYFVCYVVIVFSENRAFMVEIKIVTELPEDV